MARQENSVLATMGAFSGDGAGYTARSLEKYGVVILGGLHIKMPDSVCDSKLLKKSAKQNREIVAQADKKLERIADRIKNGDIRGRELRCFPI